MNTGEDSMMRKLKGVCGVGSLGVLLSLAAGCNSPAGMAMQLVGKAVDAAETQKLGDELIGKGPSAADEKFGQPLDTWRQVGGLSEWRVYPVSMDVLGNLRCVVQVSGRRIVAVSKVKIDGSGIELARKLLYDQKVQGKSPRECETALDLGSPLVTARSEKTGQMCQLYDAKMVPGIGSPQYCRLFFDSSQRCTEAALMDVSASTKDDPTH